MVVFGQIRCIPAKVVVLEKKWLYPGRVVVFLLIGFFLAKVAVIEQKGFIRAKLL